MELGDKSNGAQKGIRTITPVKEKRILSQQIFVF
mgnify:CR=1 FL=1